MGDELIQSESVDIVTLLPPLAEFGYITVSLYVDDRGVARGLPHNERATGLLQAVSTRAGPILGDAFLACVTPNPPALPADSDAARPRAAARTASQPRMGGKEGGGGGGRAGRIA